MIISSDAIDEMVRSMNGSVDCMNGYGEELLLALKTYTDTIEDEVGRQTKGFVTEISRQLDEMKEIITEKAELLKRGANQLNMIQSSAEDRKSK